MRSTRNQCGLLGSVMLSRLSPSPALHRTQCSCVRSFLLCERVGKNQNTVEKVALEKAKTAAESTASENATSESTARKTDDSGGPYCSL